MADRIMDERLDALAAQVHEWTESALSLDEGHFPSELLNDLEDLIEQLKVLTEEEGHDRRQVLEFFVSAEMAEVIGRFPRVRRLLERAWGAELMEMIEEEGDGFGPVDDDD